MRYAVVLGGAATVWGELAEATRLLGRDWDAVVATNHAGRDYPGSFDHWVTFHQELMPTWRQQRQQMGWPWPPHYWTVRRSMRVPVEGIAWRYVEPIGGSSGLIAAQVALQVAARVILCGVPMDPVAHYDRDPSEQWREALAHRHAWESALPFLRGRVWSMSGWTAQLLGDAKEHLHGQS